MYPDSGYKRAHAQSVCTRPFSRVGRGLGTRLGWAYVCVELVQEESVTSLRERGMVESGRYSMKFGLLIQSWLETTLRGGVTLLLLC